MQAHNPRHELFGIEQLDGWKHLPSFVVFNGCSSDDLELLEQSLALRLIEGGARSVLTTGWTIPDASAGRFSKVFMRELVDGAASIEAFRPARSVSSSSLSWTSRGVSVTPMRMSTVDLQGFGGDQLILSSGCVRLLGACASTHSAI